MVSLNLVRGFMCGTSGNCPGNNLDKSHRYVARQENLKGGGSRETD